MAAKVGVVKNDQAGISVDIKLDRPTMTFEAEFMGQVYKNKDGAELEQEISLLIDEVLNKVVWTPVIQVSLADDRYIHADNGYLGFSIQRLHIARRLDGKWVQTQWNADPARRFTDNQPLFFVTGEFTPPCPVDSERYGGTPSIYLPFTEETWEKLHTFIERIHIVRAAIHEYLRLGFVPSQLQAGDPRPKEAADVDS